MPPSNHVGSRLREVVKGVDVEGQGSLG